MTKNKKIALSIVLGLIASFTAVADTFKCGSEALTALAAATNTPPQALTAPAAGDFDKLVAEIKADEFANEKAREVALEKLKSTLEKAEWRLPEGVSRPAAVLEVLVDAATLPEAAYSIAMNRDNAAAFTSLDPKGIRDWLYGTVAGIQPGFKGDWDDFELAPVPDKRLGFVDAAKSTAKGVIKSAWKFEGGKCNWTFTIPEGTKATVCVNGLCSRYEPGEHQLEIKLPLP